MMMRAHALSVATLLVVLIGCSDTTGSGGRSDEASFSLLGDAQWGLVDRVLPDPIIVSVSNTAGQPVRGVGVTWSVSGGSGELTQLARVTDADGRATANWKLGSEPGEQHLTVTVGRLAPRVLTAVAVTALPRSIQLTPDTLTLTAGSSRSLDARVIDEHGNTIESAVQWMSSDPAAVQVSAGGLVTGLLARGATITATAGKVTAGSVVRVLAGAPSKLVIISGEGQTAPAAELLPVPLVVQVSDAYGNGIRDVEVGWEVGPSVGGALGDTQSRTDSAGFARTHWTLGRHAGAQRVTVQSPVVADGSIVFGAFATPNGVIAGSVGNLAALRGGQALSAAATAWRLEGPSVVRLTRHGLSEASGSSAAGAEPSASPTGRLIVHFRPAALGLAPGARLSMSTVAARNLEATLRSSLSRSTVARNFSVQNVAPALLAARIALDDPGDEARVRAMLEAQPDVLSVERELWMHALHDGPARSAVNIPGRVFSNDPLAAAQAWNYGLIDLPRAWSYTTGSSSVVVAVLDTGIRFDHPDIASNLTSDGYDFVSSESVIVCGQLIDNAGDGDGYDADPTQPAEYDCFSGQQSRNGSHGLHVAGTIGAAGNNQIGVTGVNWSVRIRPIRVLGVAGSGSTYDIALGILYAAGYPVEDGKGGVVVAPSRSHIINLSLGGAGYSTTLATAVRMATEAGSLVIAAAGNNASSTSFYPAAFPEVVSVSSVSAHGLPARYSNFGATIEIAAPGGDFGDGGATFGVGSTTWNFAEGQPQYGYYQGTSMAAPHVAGVAALILAREPGLSNHQLRERLTAFARDMGPPGRDDRYGAGIANARNSLTRTLSPTRELYVRLYDAASGAALQTLRAPGGEFRFEALPDGQYYVYAGADESGDGLVGRGDRLWSGQNVVGEPVLLTVDGAGTYIGSPSLDYAMEREPNDTPGLATRLMLDGYVRGTRQQPDDEDWYLITLPAGEFIFETSGWGETACGYTTAMNTSLALYDSAGAMIASNDNIDPLRRNFCSRIGISLQAGEYRLRVTGTDGPLYQLEARRGFP
jgi:subtilisin family serine protease